ncbi:MAG: hypothetical protein Q9163_003079 [Psora crenata]
MSIHDKEQRTYILVTGVNSGLGFAICQRLIDQFIITRPLSQSLTLIFTTRNAYKSNDTLSRLQRYIDQKSRVLQCALATRVTLQPESLDLTSLNTIYTLAAKLLKVIPHLDCIILNAGYGGDISINWPTAIWNIIIEPVNALTYPTYISSKPGQVTAPQCQINKSRSGGSSKARTPQPLGIIFASNVFGHYVLCHLVMPLLSASLDNGRVIFISSLESYQHVFSISDLQGLQTEVGYKSSKRLMDLLVLNSNLPSTRPFTERFLSSHSSNLQQCINTHDNERSHPFLAQRAATSRRDNNLPGATTTKPALYLSHPGICATSFVPLPLIFFYLMMLIFYVVRILGSPWHVLSPYKGACAPVWLALTQKDEIENLEATEGKGKWGAACDILGKERVIRTGVKGWGVGGRVGEGRVRTAKGRGDVGILTREGKEEFEQEGRECWKRMEELRVSWERWMIGEAE